MNNNFTTPLSDNTQVGNLNNAPAPETVDINANEPVAAEAAENEKRNGLSGAAVAGIAGAAVVSGVGLAYAANQVINGDGETVADEASDLSDAGSGIYEGAPVPPDTPKAPSTPKDPEDGAIAEEDLTDFQRSTVDHADSNFADWNEDPETGTPSNPGGNTDLAELPDVDPDLATADMAQDVYLIDEVDEGDPSYFFNPTDMAVANIDGSMVTAVEATLPTGETVYLLDSDGDGNFDVVYDSDGNAIADGSDLTATTVDDAASILMDKGVDVPGADGNEVAEMADVNEFVDDSNGQMAFEPDGLEEPAIEEPGVDDLASIDDFGADM